MWLWYFLIIFTYFFVFDQTLHQATRFDNLVQLFNAESYAIGIKPVRGHGIDDAIVKYVFDKFVGYNGYAYVPDNIDTEWLIQFSCDNIALLKAKVDSKLFTLNCTEMMALQHISDNSWQKALCNRATDLQAWPSVGPFHKLDKTNFHQMEDLIAVFK